MDIETILSILFIVLFVVIPFMKEIMQKKSGNDEDEETPKAGERTAQQIREYLERMRGNATDASTQYRPPSTRPSGAQAGSTQPKQKPAKKAAPAAQKQSQPEPKKSLPALTPSIPEIKHAEHIEVPKPNIIHTIMVDTRFSDVQKALIFHEIFRRPAVLEESKK